MIKIDYMITTLIIIIIILKIKKIDSKSNLSKNNEAEMVTSNKLYNLILNEYGITDSYFTYKKS